MAMPISYRTSLRAALAASWLALAAASAAVADFDDGFMAYLSSNYPRAFKVWEPLAEAGGIEAQFGLGMLYERGQGVGRDLASAATWYGRAAEQGSMRAQTQLGGMYARGDGVAGDWDQAIAWWRRAAAQGSERAKFHLGQAYHYGSGVERDLEQALQWYDESAALGFHPAALLIEEINRLREAEEKAATDSVGSSRVLLSLVVPRPSSVFHESASDLASRDQSRLIALGGGPARPLDGAHRVYLASYHSVQTASEGWQKLAGANPALLSGLDAAVAQADLGRDKGIVYRLQAGPLPGIEAANALCHKLSQRDIHCVAVAP